MKEKQNKIEKLLMSAKVVSGEASIDAAFKSKLKEDLLKAYLESTPISPWQKFQNGISKLHLGIKVGAITLILALLSLAVLAATASIGDNQKIQIADTDNPINKTYTLQYNSQITSIEGEVIILDQNGEELAATLNTEVLPGSTIITKENSKAEITFGNNNSTRLDENTKLLINESSTDMNVLDLIVGNTYHRVTTTEKDSHVVTSLNVNTNSQETSYSFAANSKEINIVAFENDVDFKVENNSSSVKEFTKVTIDLEGLEQKVAELSETDYNSDFLAWSRNQDKNNGYAYDETGPTISLLSPADGSSTYNSIIALIGMIKDSSNLQKIIVNNTEYLGVKDGKGFNPKDGSFNVDVPLAFGDNQIDIHAYDQYWNESTESLVIKKNSKPNNVLGDTYEVYTPTPIPYTPTPVPPTPTTAPFITLNSATPGATGCTFNVSISFHGYSSTHGFKILYQKGTDPIQSTRIYAQSEAITTPTGDYTVWACTSSSSGSSCTSPISNAKTVTVVENTPCF